MALISLIAFLDLTFAIIFIILQLAERGNNIIRGIFVTFHKSSCLPVHAFISENCRNPRKL